MKDTTKLLAEVESLRAQVQALREGFNAAQDELGRALAENAALRAAVADALGHLMYGPADDKTAAILAARDALRAALGGAK